ncbi:MAG: RES family NAD+ phosphorylase [Sphingomonadales bacterium]|nr:RES family NAD+ phosphorylase [Sphingomonadaceae bacterium]MBS3930473.1 RES family NAD+ phosphorylase [Sphingomonadales bacterium]
MWTSTALASEHRRYAGEVWRVVEAQHRISTNRLAASGEEQALLEDLVEEIKPRLPEAARHLDYLLAAPFRYGHNQASRFRRAEERPGIFYSSESETTAIAEAAYWKLRFFSRSPGFEPPSTTSEHTSFRASVATERAIDLTLAPFDQRAANWIDPSDYTACQELAATAREAKTELIRTHSARDPLRGCNIVVLEPTAFTRRSPKLGKTWHFRFQEGKLLALAALPSRERLEFSANGFGLGL